MSPDRVHDLFGNPMSLQEVGSDRRVRPLDLMVDGLADVVQETRQLGDSNVCADLGRHHGGEIRDLVRGVEPLLPVAGAKPKDAEMADDLGMKSLQADLQDRGLSLLFDPLQDLDSGLGNDLFDPGRMNPAVDDELVQRDPRHLAADGIEAADDDGFRGVVDYEVDPGRLLQGADVAPFFADDATLELVGRQRQHRDRDLGGLVRGDALYRLGDDLAGTTLAFVAGGQLGFADLAGDLVPELLLDLRHQDPLSFLAGHVGDPLQLL